ncbi:LRR and PYD domains-containing 3-like protein [Labeo rohita]|uniref:LRR and PYD domains-containing 3-like protein n=1 Tax=Labeo rohita TaxID=84645 RepID=A0A498LWV9_LABRO|nr:LRR and PYD domains-containing 3-like protein [Labeo rohita]
MSSGRINVRKGTCPVAGCKKETSRLDRHLMTHTELNKTVRRNALEACKRQKILGDLASLRASNPEEPMVSTLDIDEAQDVSDVPPVPEEEVEECSNPGCKAQKKKLQDEVADLSKQIDTLTEALRDVSRKYRLLRKRSLPTPSGQVARVTRTLLSAISSPEEKEGPEQSVAEPEEQEEEGPGPSKKTRTTTMAHPFPDHVPALSEY